MKDKDSVILVSDKGKSHFALPILNSISKKMKSYHSESKHNIIHRIRSRNKKIVWVEWARQESIYMSKIVKKNQKLFIRLHRY